MPFLLPPTIPFHHLAQTGMRPLRSKGGNMHLSCSRLCLMGLLFSSPLPLLSKQMPNFRGSTLKNLNRKPIKTRGLRGKNTSFVKEREREKKLLSRNTQKMDIGIIFHCGRAFQINTLNSVSVTSWMSGKKESVFLAIKVQLEIHYNPC